MAPITPSKLIDYLVIFSNLEKYIIYLKSPQNPYQLYKPEKTSKCSGSYIHGAGVAWPPAYPLLKFLEPLKLCWHLTAFNSRSRQKDAFDGELRLIKLNKKRHSRLKWR